MDQEEVERRAPGILLGFFTLMTGGALTLLGIMYDPVDAAAPGGGLLEPGTPGTPSDPTSGLGETASQSGSPGLFVLMAVTGVVLGGWSAYLFRGAKGMVLMSGVVCLVAAFNLYGVLTAT